MSDNETKIICWNVQRPQRSGPPTVLETISDPSCHIVCLQESKLQLVDSSLQPPLVDIASAGLLKGRLSALGEESLCYGIKMRSTSSMLMSALSSFLAMVTNAVFPHSYEPVGLILTAHPLEIRILFCLATARPSRLIREACPSTSLITSCTAKLVGPNSTQSICWLAYSFPHTPPGAPGQGIRPGVLAVCPIYSFPPPSLRPPCPPPYPCRILEIQNVIDLDSSAAFSSAHLLQGVGQPVVAGRRWIGQSPRGARMPRRTRPQQRTPPPSPRSPSADGGGGGWMGGGRRLGAGR
jgi:hypothetical protein